jgi:hypothetical protein
LTLLKNSLYCKWTARSLIFGGSPKFIYRLIGGGAMENEFLSAGERFVTADDPCLQYTGRIDFDDPSAPVFVYPYTSVKLRFTGTKLKVVLKNKNLYWDNYLGFVIDGVQHRIQIPEHDKTICLTLAENLEDREHELFFFKRMDACHILTFYGFILDKDAQVAAPEEKPARKIEVFGDSVSAGEVAEAVAYTGKLDPVHNGEYSNSWFSYAAMTARKLNAQLHDVAQGGIALLHGTGWYCEPDAIGMEETWDKIQYNPEFGAIKQWDFKRYVPHVVIVALGQNDSHPVDYMQKDPGGSKSENWRRHYEAFLRNIRRTYPKALIIAATTILQHDKNWDDSIDEVCRRIGDPKTVHFLYSRNGAGTPGHIRISEAEEMSDELSAFIASFGESIWE